MTKKKFFGLISIGLFALLVTLMITGCSSDSDTSETSGAAESDETEKDGDAFPEKSINIYSPYSPGGYVDIITRVLADGLEKELGVSVNVSDKSGGGGIVATTDISQQNPDGYTLSAASDISHMHFEDVPYEIDSFTYVSSMAYAHHPLMVRADSEWDSIEDVLEYAKENPGKLKWGSGGIVNPVVLVARELFVENNIEANQVPYNGGAEVLGALLAGDVDVGIIADFNSALEAGDIKLLAESSIEADPNYPEVKTLADLGYINEGPPTVYGIIGPKDIPEDALEVLNNAIEKVINSEDFGSQLKKIGVQPFYKNSEEYQEIMFNEDKRLGDVVPKYTKESDK